MEIRTPDLRITSRKREFTVQSPHLPVFADMRNAVCPGLMAAAGVVPTAPHQTHDDQVHHNRGPFLANVPPRPEVQAEQHQPVAEIAGGEGHS